MSKALLYVYHPAAGAVTAGSAVPLGTNGNIVRRYGACSLNLENNAVSLLKEGFYAVDATVVATAAAAGTLTATLYQDGTAVPGATVSAAAAAAGDAVTLTLPSSAVRMFCRQCQSVLTVRLSGGDATAAAISVRVEKE